MPSEGTVRGWVRDNVGGIATRYARARDLGIDAHAEELLYIADVGSGDVRRDRLRSDNRKWLLTKLFPKQLTRMPPPVVSFSQANTAELRTRLRAVIEKV
jgi:hypothetical protein